MAASQGEARNRDTWDHGITLSLHRLGLDGKSKHLSTFTSDVA